MLTEASIRAAIKRIDGELKYYPGSDPRDEQARETMQSDRKSFCHILHLLTSGFYDEANEYAESLDTIVKDEYLQG